VSKSTFAIAALGAGACVLLSLMMQELVQHDGSARRVAYLPSLESKFASRLDGPLRVREEQADGILRLVVTARAVAGLDRERFATALGQEVWLHALRSGTQARDLVVVVRTAGEPRPASVQVPRPIPRR
jgi:hypothetical protein